MNRQFFTSCYDTISKTLFAVAVVAIAAVSPVSAAADPVTVTIPDTGLDWSNMSDSIMGAIAEPLGIGIGCGLAVWLVMLAVKLLKKPVK